MTLRAHHTAPGEGAAYEMIDGSHVVKSSAARTDGAFEVFEVTAPGGPEAPPHAAPWHGVMYLLEGRLRIRTGGTSYDLRPGSTAILPAEVAYRFEVVGDSARFLAVTSGDGAGRFFADFAATVPLDRPVPDVLPLIMAVTSRHGVTIVDAAP